jgi:cytochrome c-type biogenesis protein CcmE
MVSTETSRRPATRRSPAAARKRRRLLFLITALIVLGAAAALILTAFRDSIVYFYTPSELAEKHVPPGQNLRIGGLVEAGSLTRDGDTVRFRITDLKDAVPVRYRGILPDLFREGQGVVALGALEPDGTFRASQVLAKHDETYMPPEVAEALKKSGEWRPEGSNTTGGTATGGKPSARPSPSAPSSQPSPQGTGR